MPIEVEGPDGTVIEFPEGTAPETIKGVMAKHYKSIAKLPGGKTLEIDVPEGAGDETIRRLGQEALDARKVRGRAVVAPPSAMEAVGGAAQDFGTNLTNGFFALPDLLSEAGNGITNAFKGVAKFALTGGGASPRGADWTGNALEPTAAPTMRGVNDRINPGAYDRSNTAFGIEMLGAAMMPIPGMKAPAKSAFAGMPKAVPAASALSPKAVPGARDIIAAGEREGVRVMTTDVRPPRTMIGKSARGLGDKILIAGTGGPRAAQQEERIGAVKRLLNDFGANGADDAVEAVSADLVQTRGAELSKLATAKTSVIEGVKDRVPPAMMLGTLKAIDAQIAKLNGINADAYAPVVAKLNNFRETIATGKTLAQIEGNRKLLGDLFADPSLAAIKGDGQKALNAIYKPLRDDMGAVIADKAGQPARARWQAANERLAAMAGELDARAFKNVLNNAETTPEAAGKVIFGKTPSDMRRLYGNLSDAGKVKVQSAILFRAAEGATENGVVSPQKFATAMDKMQQASGVFFSPADKARIDGMTRLLKATQHASEAAANPVTGAQAVPYAIGAGFTSLFGIPGGITAAGVTGLVARAYESAPVRNRLIRLARSKPGSKAEGIVMNDLARFLTKLAPTAANDVKGALVASPGRAAASEQEDD